MRYILATDDTGYRRLFATTDADKLDAYLDLARSYGCQLDEIAVPAGLHSLAALTAETVLDAQDRRRAAEPEDGASQARAAIERGLSKRGVGATLAAKVYEHAAKAPKVDLDLGEEAPPPVAPPPRAARPAPPPPPVEDYGDGDAPMPRRGQGGEGAPPRGALNLTNGGASKVLEIGTDGQAYEVPGWRPVQRRGDQVERAPGAGKRID